MVRILVAEDEPRLSAFIEKGLTQEGMEVFITRDGPQTLRRLQTERFDIMVLDIGLPGVDGWQILEQVQPRSNLPPTLIITARVNAFYHAERLDAPVETILVKPFRFRDLLSRIHQILDRA